MGTWGQFPQATLTLDFGSIAAQADAELTGTVTGAKTGQPVVVSAPDLEDDLVATAYVSATDTVTVRVTNPSAGAIDPASQSFYVACIR